MRAVVQRSKRAYVSVDEEKQGEIEKGLVVFLGVGKEDREDDAYYLAEKVAGLRIFPDEQGKMNLSVLDKGESVLVISQFTLYGDCRKGKRPSFSQAAAPSQAVPLYNLFCTLLAEKGLQVKKGVFGAEMMVYVENSGPVTILLDSRKTF